MGIDLKRIGLFRLMEDNLPCYSKLTKEEKELVNKVGLFQTDTLGESYEWKDLSVLTNDELYELYKSCLDSWKR